MSSLKDQKAADLAYITAMPREIRAQMIRQVSTAAVAMRETCGVGPIRDCDLRVSTLLRAAARAAA